MRSGDIAWRIVMDTQRDDGDNRPPMEEVFGLSTPFMRAPAPRDAAASWPRLIEALQAPVRSATIIVDGTGSHQRCATAGQGPLLGEARRLIAAQAVVDFGNHCSGSACPGAAQGGCGSNVAGRRWQVRPCTKTTPTLHLRGGLYLTRHASELADRVHEAPGGTDFCSRMTTRA